MALDPAFPHARYHLGVALGDAAQYDEAITWLQQVLAAEPEHAEACHSLGYCYSRLGQPAPAVAAFERAVALRPDAAQAHVNLGLALLQLGDYPRGLAEYEWRWRTGRFTPVQCPHPPWDGRPIPTQTLLIHTEPGAGETLQFARYLPLAAQRCGRLVLACPAALMPLLAIVPGVAEICEPGTVTAAEFDSHLPLLSLPRVLGTTRATIPAAVPYLDVAALRRRRDPTALLRFGPSTRPALGLVWADHPTRPHDRRPACALRDWAAVLRTPGLAWYSLQTGERRQELAERPPEVPIHDLSAHLHDWGDAALLLDQLDLVITVDTTVAHLVGALGKPAWVLLHDGPEWCWGVEGERTPWYPTLRLFRQARAGGWAELMQRVAHALAAWRETAWHGGNGDSQ